MKKHNFVVGELVNYRGSIWRIDHVTCINSTANMKREGDGLLIQIPISECMLMFSKGEVSFTSNSPDIPLPVNNKTPAKDQRPILGDTFS